MNQFEKIHDLTVSKHLSKYPYTQRKQQNNSIYNETKENTSAQNLNPIQSELKKTHRNNYQYNTENQFSPIKNLNENSYNNFLKEYQTLKIQISFIKSQNQELRKQNQFLSQQTKKINQNYLMFLDEQQRSQQEKSSMIEIVKLKYHEQFIFLQKRFNEKENHLKQIIKNYQKSIQNLKSENLNLNERIPHYQKNIYNKNLQLEDLKNHLNRLKLQFECIQTNYQKEMLTFLQKKQFLQKQVQIDNKQICVLKENKKQMQKQIQILLKIQEQKSNQNFNLKSTIQSLGIQISTLKKINDEQIIKYQNLVLKLKEEQKSIKQYKLIVNVIKQQNSCLLREIDNKKQREMNMIECEKSNREKYSMTLEKKNIQITDLIIQNERLYKQINKIKFQIKKQVF